MEHYDVTVSPEAQRDIEAIWLYIHDQLSNPDAAERFIRGTDDAISDLENFPYAHQERSSSEVSSSRGKRQYPYRRNYILFYSVYEDIKKVVVLKVSYSRRDFSDL